jgi:hypothetical protein
VVLVDDSIVRGTTSRKIVRMVRSAGAREVHVRISCPPTISPCFYGVDTPQRADLIAATHTIEEIRKYLDADSVSYLSLDGLTGAVNGGRTRYCTSCYTGVYPVAFPRDEAAYLQLALKLNPEPARDEPQPIEASIVDKKELVDREEFAGRKEFVGKEEASADGSRPLARAGASH